jgi:hypothetical protein
MQTQQGGVIPEDEIDIGSLGRRITAFFNYLFFLLSSNIKTTLLFVLLGIGMAIATKFLVPKTYKASFIIRPNDRTERFHLKIIGDIQSLLKQGDFQTVASELKIDSPTARSLVKLETFNAKVKSSPDSVNFSEITIHSTDKSSFSKIQNSIINYLENNPYFAKIRTLQKNQIDLSIVQVESDLLRLDSLKKLQLGSYEREKTMPQNAFILNELVNPTAAYAMGIDRTNKKIQLMAQQAFLENFQIIKSCVTPSRHYSPPRILFMCLAFVPLCLLLCLIFLHLKTRKIDKGKPV